MLWTPAVVISLTYLKKSPIFYFIVLMVFIVFLLYFLCSYWLDKRIRSGNRFFSLNTDVSKFTRIIYTLSFYSFRFGIGFVAFWTFSILFTLPLQKLFPDPQHLDKMDATDIKKHLWSNLFDCLFSGTEEVWRVCSVIVLLFFLKKAFPLKWSSLKFQWSMMLLCFIFIAFIFGWLHSFGYSNQFFSLPITVMLGLVGLSLTLVLLITRSLFMTMTIHILNNVIVTFNLIECYGVSGSIFGLVLVLLGVGGILFFRLLEKYHESSNVHFLISQKNNPSF